MWTSGCAEVGINEDDLEQEIEFKWTNKYDSDYWKFVAKVTPGTTPVEGFEVDPMIPLRLLKHV